MVPVDHECQLKDVVADQAAEIDKLKHELAQLKKALFGRKSEKMPRIEKLLGVADVPAEEQQATRRARAKERSELLTERVEHKVPETEKKCPQCGGERFSPMGEGRTTVVYEYVPARVLRREHVQEVLRCACGECVLTAPGAPKVIEGGRYGASFLAHLVVAKCADSIPIYRIEKDFKRQGVPVSRSTMNELFHRAADILSPLSSLLLEQIRHRHLVLADETSLRMLDDGNGKPKTGFVWTFQAPDENGVADVSYVFAKGRSSETPRTVLKDTSGVLLVDGYSGYNSVDDVSTRVRAACHAHARRYFHEALPTSPIASQAIDFIVELYRVEHDAKTLNVIGTEQHLAMRQERSKPVREQFEAWLAKQLSLHPPRSPLGVAIRYTQGQWTELGRFLDDARIPLDNNASERALRRVALGRKNFLFVRDIESGENIAGLYSLIATCEARGINPFAYLADVLTRVQDHPHRRLDELLPAAWAAARAQA